MNFNPNCSSVVLELGRANLEDIKNELASIGMIEESLKTDADVFDLDCGFKVELFEGEVDIAPLDILYTEELYPDMLRMEKLFGVDFKQATAGLSWDIENYKEWKRNIPETDAPVV